MRTVKLPRPGFFQLDTSKNPIWPQVGSKNSNGLAPREIAYLEVFRGVQLASSIIGVLFTSRGLSFLIGPALAGVAYDVLGSYQLPILGSAVLSALGAGAIIKMLPRKLECAAISTMK